MYNSLVVFPVCKNVCEIMVIMSLPNLLIDATRLCCDVPGNLSYEDLGYNILGLGVHFLDRC